MNTDTFKEEVFWTYCKITTIDESNYSSISSGLEKSHKLAYSDNQEHQNNVNSKSVANFG